MGSEYYTLRKTVLAQKLSASGEMGGVAEGDRTKLAPIVGSGGKGPGELSEEQSLCSED